MHSLFDVFNSEPYEAVPVPLERQDHGLGGFPVTLDSDTGLRANEGHLDKALSYRVV